MKPLVLIEPGHGGWQKGCQYDPGSGPRLIEKDWTLQAGLDLEQALTGPNHAVHVALTRRGDVYVKPADRKTQEWRIRPALVLSIHVNADRNPLHGMQTYYWPGNNDGLELATDILRRAPEPLAYYGKPFKAFDDPDDPNDDWLSRPQEVVSLYHATTVLVEVGYMSYRTDREYIHSAVGRAQITKCLAGAIVRWADKRSF